MPRLASRLLPSTLQGSSSDRGNPHPKSTKTNHNHPESEPQKQRKPTQNKQPKNKHQAKTKSTKVASGGQFWPTGTSHTSDPAQGPVASRKASRTFETQSKSERDDSSVKSDQVATHRRESTDKLATLASSPGTKTCKGWRPPADQGGL